MTPVAALISNGMIFIGMFAWYRIVLQIYNRFKLDYSQGTPWEDTQEDYSLFDGIDELSKDYNGVQSLSFQSNTSKMKSVDVSAPAAKDIDDVGRFGDYISLKVNGQWKRIYATVVGGTMLFYGDKRTAENNPTNLFQNRRPIELGTWEIRPAGDSDQPPYIIHLLNTDDIAESNGKARSLEFSCDTMTEVVNWMKVLRAGREFAQVKERLTGLPMHAHQLSAEGVNGVGKRDWETSSLASVLRRPLKTEAVVSPLFANHK